MRQFFKLFLAIVVFLTTPSIVDAVELLVGGDFEPSGGSIPGWDLQEFATGSAENVDVAQLVGFGPISGEFDLWLRPFVGGEDPGPNNLTNAVLSQEVPGTAGESYEFSGWSRWETNYSGGVATLGADGPLGAVSSPTTTTMELAFLDAGGSVIGSPVSLDLSTEQANFNFWVEHTLNGVAPTGTANIRVTAEARDMVWNVGANQSAFYDNFSLTGLSEPETEILVNPDLEDPPPTGLEQWTLESNDPENPDNDEVIRTAGFANRTPGGQSGVWLSSFFGEAGTEVDGTVSQTVEGMPGGTYTFSGWSRYEANFSGGDPSFSTQNFMEIAFLDDMDAVIGSPVMFDVDADRVVQSSTNDANDNEWYQHTFDAVAPAGTASVRVTAGMEDGINTTLNPQSAFFDDFSLDGPGGLLADADADGDVDGTDFLLIQRNNPALISQWQTEYGTGSLSASLASQAIPEPSTAIGLLVGAAIFLTRKTR